MGQVILTEHDPLMRGNHAAIISRYDASILESLREFLESIGYVGFANFDLKIDPRTQTAYVFECNPRLGRSSFYLRAAGMNILKIFTEDVVYGHREDCMFADTTALWRNVPMAVLKRYGQNRTLVQEAETLAGKGLCMSTRGCHEDRNLLRSLEMLRYDLALARSYRRYPSAGDGWKWKIVGYEQKIDEKTYSSADHSGDIALCRLCRYSDTAQCPAKL